jgi:hypothetical protein
VDSAIRICNLRLAGNEPPVVLALFANLNAQARNRGKYV